MSRRLASYRFDEYEVDLLTRELRSASGVVRLEPRAFDLLVYLLENRDRLVPKEELKTVAWDVEFVTDNSVSSAVTRIRRALHDRRSPSRFVTTVYGHGYRFSAEVEDVHAPEAVADTSPAAADDLSEPSSAGRWAWGLGQTLLVAWRRFINL